MKTLLKWLMPSSQKIADYAADAFQKVVNDKLADKKDYIVRGAQISEQVVKVQEYLTKWLADGSMDDEEKAVLSSALKPLVDMVVERL